MALSDFIKITNAPSHKEKKPPAQKPASGPVIKSPGMDSKQLMAIILLLIGLGLVGAAIMLW